MSKGTTGELSWALKIWISNFGCGDLKLGLGIFQNDSMCVYSGSPHARDPKSQMPNPKSLIPTPNPKSESASPMSKGTTGELFWDLEDLDFELRMWRF
jgi:hypothetical protein